MTYYNARRVFAAAFARASIFGSLSLEENFVKAGVGPCHCNWSTFLNSRALVRKVARRLNSNACFFLARQQFFCERFNRSVLVQQPDCCRLADARNTGITVSGLIPFSLSLL